MAKKKNLQQGSSSQVDRHVMKQLMRMTEGSYEESGLDPETFMLVRISALTAMGASPASWMMNLKAGKELEIPPELAIGTLTAIAPIVGTARTVTAAGNIIKAIGLAEGFKDETEEKTKANYAHY
jgi:4-carboxymuconolactone decarboxylase